jgi:adenylate cyclase
LCFVGGDPVTTQRTKRKLTAIFSADAKGYSRLMSQDEEGTVGMLNEYREIMTVLIHKHMGRIVDSPGDNLLAEFASVVNAVECAVKVQEELKRRNEAIPENFAMLFRIGINLGDVIEREGRIYGDGVNIAARVEGLAEGGGVCLSGNVYEQVKNKLNLDYEYVGEHHLKNIPEPVRVFRVNLAFEPSVAERLKPIELPEKPSIAVLPFVNMSGDPEQEYFSDGITEEIITGLSRIPELFVIARNSSFTYKGKPTKVQQVGVELGVRYVLEGSVRKADDRVRITAQLIDAKTGHHLWADRYNRELKDVFSVQDEITVKIMRAMQVELTEGEQACEWLKGGSENLEAYEKGMRGMEFFRRFSPEGNFQARQMFAEGISLDPETPGNYVMLAWTHLNDVYNGWTDSPETSLEKATELTRKALGLNDLQADAHALLGNIYLLERNFDKAIEEGEYAVRLNPNGADARVWLAMILTSAGRPDEAIDLIQKAMRLNPFPPNWYYYSLGNAYLWMRQYQDAVQEYLKALQHSPDFLLAHLGLAVAYQSSGCEKEAIDTTREILRIDPRFSLQHLAATMSFKSYRDLELMIDTLRKAGLK